MSFAGNGVIRLENVGVPHKKAQIQVSGYLDGVEYKQILVGRI